MTINKRALAQQLLSIRAQIDAALFLLHEEGDARILSADDIADNDGEPECEHPKDRRRNESTMGHKRWRCLDCGHMEEVDD